MENRELVEAIQVALCCVKIYPKEKIQVPHKLGYLELKEKQDDVLDLLEHQLKSLLVINSLPENYDKHKENFPILYEDKEVKELLFEKCTSFKVLEDNKLIRNCISILKYREQNKINERKAKELISLTKLADDEFIGLDKIQE